MFSVDAVRMLTVSCRGDYIHRYCKHLALSVGEILDETSQSEIYTEGADKSLARTTSRCILFDGENISFDASLVLCI
jgi:hypothetical protein